MEAVVTVVRNSTAAVGSTVVLTSVMSVNGTDVTTDTITLTITNTLDTIEYIDLEVSIAYFQLYSALQQCRRVFLLTLFIVYNRVISR